MSDALRGEFEAVALSTDAWWVVADVLRGRLGGVPDAQAHLMAFDYVLTFPGTRKRERYGTFGPRHEFDAPDPMTGYPPPVGLMSSAVVDVWRNSAEVASAPLASSRYADLVHVFDSPREGSLPSHFAIKATKAYAALVHNPAGLRPAALTAGALRAAELADHLMDTELRTIVAAAIEAALARTTVKGLVRPLREALRLAIRGTGS